MYYVFLQPQYIHKHNKCNKSVPFIRMIGMEEERVTKRWGDAERSEVNWGEGMGGREGSREMGREGVVRG